MASQNTTSSLSDVNSATLGAKFPEITLPDGSKVQTGTVGALLVNIRTYNVAHADGDAATTEALEASFRAALPLLDKVGLFDLFTPSDWIRGDNEGRKAVGRLYQEFKAIHLQK
ncbi:hypothetical protein SAMD00023353_7100080 [Rosellinia necatrix]|uniref:DUF7709 domain-containing protein n=1 Tax=Rosellinia necatrix TaxID=77044 RepID=A0A1S8AAQ4_ROSNE|nr:hypothetical protein SAMD00023353_7100080 [Rosellinia necatrix]